MHSTLTGIFPSAESDVRRACDVGESGVEILLEVVVENAGLTVVLGDDGDERPDINRLHFALVVVVLS